MTTPLRLALCLGLLVPAKAIAQPACTPDSDTVCIPEEDLARFVALARERKCLDDSRPAFTIDSIAIVTDADGRVFYSGADHEKPYKLTMTWCHIERTVSRACR